MNGESCETTVQPNTTLMNAVHCTYFIASNPIFRAFFSGPTVRNRCIASRRFDNDGRVAFMRRRRLCPSNGIFLPRHPAGEEGKEGRCFKCHFNGPINAASRIPRPILRPLATLPFYRRQKVFQTDLTLCLLRKNYIQQLNACRRSCFS